MWTILWDNDGVLVNTEGLYFQTCREALAGIGITLTLEHFKELSLQRGESTFLLAREQGVSEEEIARLRQERDRQYTARLRERSVVIDGVQDVLQALYGKVAMGVVTSAQRQHFEAAHAESGLRRYFEFELTREDYVRSKPHPEPYLTALERHGLDASQCIVVEDSERGMASAVGAGLDCIVVRSEWTSHGNFARASAIAEDIAEVHRLIQQRVS